MSEFGVLASRFEVNNRSLRDFDTALRSYKRTKDDKQKDKDIAKLLLVLSPIWEVLVGNLSDSMSINETRVIEILREKHWREWASYKDAVIRTIGKLKQHEVNLTSEEINILNDIGDALDSECSFLFEKMRGTR